MDKRLKGLLEGDPISIQYSKDWSHLEITSEDGNSSTKIIDFYIEIDNSVKSVRDDIKIYLVDLSKTQRIEVLGKKDDILQFLEFVNVENPSKLFDWNGQYDNLLGFFVVIQFIISLIIIDNRGSSWSDFYLDTPSLLISIVSVIYTYYIIAKLSLNYMELRYFKIQSISEKYNFIKISDNHRTNDRTSLVVNFLGVIVLLMSVLTIFIYFNPTVSIYLVSILLTIFILNKS